MEFILTCGHETLVDDAVQAVATNNNSSKEVMMPGEINLDIKTHLKIENRPGISVMIFEN